jgi:hypothetical protein
LLLKLLEGLLPPLDIISISPLAEKRVIRVLGAYLKYSRSKTFDEISVVAYENDSAL